jgi:glucoamylase
MFCFPRSRHARNGLSTVGLSTLALTVALGLSLTCATQAQEPPPNHNPTLNSGGPAIDGPGKPSAWAYSGKQGIGTAYEAYKDYAFSDQAVTGTVSKVWFSLAQGILTETMYGRIHEAQLREMQIIVAGRDFTAFEKDDCTSRVDYIDKDKAGRPLSPAYRLTNTDKKGRFVIIKDVFTDPDQQSLMVRVTVKALKGPVRAYVLLDPSVANTSGNDQGTASTAALSAYEGPHALSLVASQPFMRAHVGYTGANDGLEDLIKAHRLNAADPATTKGPGNIVLLGALGEVTGSKTVDLVIGFGASVAQATAEARSTLKTGYAEVLARFNGTGTRIGWEDYLSGLSELKSLVPLSEDNGKLLYASALSLKVQEDHTAAGALIASLSNPWGDTQVTDVSATGYKAVWPRDFYQVSMALAALGDHETPIAAFRYLPQVQVGPETPGNKGDGGWFLQKSHVDGTPEWVGVQLDQTAMPIMLGWRLYEMGLISKDELSGAYGKSLKRAADFLSDGGQVNLGWNSSRITPPFSQQERWEEQPGHSPSTTAAVIAGLQTAASVASMAGDTQGAGKYAQKAADYSQKVETRMFTPSGKVLGADKPASYYLRLSHSDDARDPGKAESRNGQDEASADLMLDGGFLELVRYGVRSADDTHIAQTLNVFDDQTLPDDRRVRYDFRFTGKSGVYPGWRRYGLDGYGDRTSGGNYAVNSVMKPDQRGRVWPIFTGERGHYELALAARKPAGVTAADVTRIRQTYVAAMELFANEGLMIPEQVFDNVGSPGPHKYQSGEGTDSATPLAWSHAEYVKLLRSLRDKQVWDRNAPAYQTFAGKP